MIEWRVDGDVWLNSVGGIHTHGPVGEIPCTIIGNVTSLVIPGVGVIAR